MKKIIISIVIIMSLMTFSSCLKDPHQIRYGFDCSIHRDSKGLVLAHVHRHTEYVYLCGYIDLNEGTVQIDLLNGNDESVYTSIITGPVHFAINETFIAEDGYWKLKYKSIDGNGSMDLHMNY